MQYTPIFGYMSIIIFLIYFMFSDLFNETATGGRGLAGHIWPRPPYVIILPSVRKTHDSRVK